jgi:hypothetical protein
VNIAKGQLLAYGTGANMSKFVLFTADHTATKTSDPVGFADATVSAGEMVTAICEGIMGDDGSGTPIQGNPGRYLFGGMTAGAIQVAAEAVATDIVCVVGQWVAANMGVETAGLTDKFVIRMMPAMLVTGQPS